MADMNMIVSDALLKQLSAETNKVGKLVSIKETRLMPELMAYISNVIIMPHSEFYRNQFMNFYKQYNQNAVKALKELAIDFPYAPDYELGLAFVITLKSSVNDHQDQFKILLAHEFDLREDRSLSDFRQKIYSGNTFSSQVLPE